MSTPNSHMHVFCPPEVVLWSYLIRARSPWPLCCQRNHGNTSLQHVTLQGPWPLCTQESRRPCLPAPSSCPLPAATPGSRGHPSNGATPPVLPGWVETGLSLPLVWGIGRSSCWSGVSWDWEWWSEVTAHNKAKQYCYSYCGHIWSERRDWEDIWAKWGDSGSHDACWTRTVKKWLPRPLCDHHTSLCSDILQLHKL